MKLTAASKQVDGSRAASIEEIPGRSHSGRDIGRGSRKPERRLGKDSGSQSRIGRAGKQDHHTGRNASGVKRVDLERHLRSHGCQLYREGGRPSAGWNPANRKTSAVPRHREVEDPTPNLQIFQKSGIGFQPMFSGGSSAGCRCHGPISALFLPSPGNIKTPLCSEAPSSHLRTPPHKPGIGSDVLPWIRQ